MPLFRHPILLAPPGTSAFTAGVTVSWSTPGPSRASPTRWSTTTMAELFDDRDSPIYATRGSYALGSFRGEAF